MDTQYRIAVQRFKIQSGFVFVAEWLSVSQATEESLNSLNIQQGSSCSPAAVFFWEKKKKNLNKHSNSAVDKASLRYSLSSVRQFTVKKIIVKFKNLLAASDK